MHQAATAWHCFWSHPRSFALLWLRLPCCLISVPFALPMPTLAGASTSTSSGSMKYSRHAACGKRHAALPQLTTHYNCPKTRSGNEVGEVGVAIGSSCCSWSSVWCCHLIGSFSTRAAGASTGQRVGKGKGKGKGGAALLCGASERMTSTIYSPSWTFAARQQESENSLAFPFFCWHTNRWARPLPHFTLPTHLVCPFRLAR